MKRISGLSIVFILLIVSGARASSLEVFAGAIGGAGNGNIKQGCTTYVSPYVSFFGSATSFAVPQGGVTACNYFGGTSDLLSAVGPLSTSQSVTGAVIPDSPPGSYNGSASSHAQYGIVGAAANGTLMGSLSSTVLDEAMGAAFFTDTLTLNSPNVVNGNSGFIAFRFTIDGSLTAGSGPSHEGALLSVSSGNSAADLIYQAATFNSGNVTMNSINGSSTAPAGYTFTPTGLFGSADFQTALFPLTFGTSAPLKVGLLAEALGTGDASFASTARLTGIFVYDSQGNPVQIFSISSESGTRYGAGGVETAATPEPFTMLLVGLGLLGMVAFRSLRTNPKNPDCTDAGHRAGPRAAGVQCVLQPEEFTGAFQPKH
jgi:hypothetical protein